MKLGYRRKKIKVLQKKQVEGTNHREVEEEREDEEVASYILVEDSANSPRSVELRPQDLKQDGLIASLLFIIHVTLSKKLDLSKPWFLMLQNGGHFIYLVRFLLKIAWYHVFELL